MCSYMKGQLSTEYQLDFFDADNYQFGFIRICINKTKQIMSVTPWY